MRGNNIADEVAANVERQRRKQSKMDAKARAMANKMNKLDMAMETTLAESFADLNAELNSFGRAKGAKLKYLQEQYNSRKLLRQGVYIPVHSHAIGISIQNQTTQVEDASAPRPCEINKHY